MGSETEARERQSVFLSEYWFREKKVQGQATVPLKTYWAGGISLDVNSR